MSKRVVILGAGYAGIKTALTLYKKKKKGEELEIILIDRNSYHTLMTELHEVAGNRISEDGVTVPLRDIFRYTDVKLVKDEITSVDFEKNVLVSQSGEYHYDYLVFAAGSEPNFYGIPGMKEHSFTLWSLEDAVRIREHIKDCFAKASQTGDQTARKSILTFAVGGGGFTGVEMIGELALWSKSLCAEYGIPRDDVRLVLLEALPTILSNLKEKSIRKATDYLVKKLKVEVLSNSQISKVDSEAFYMEDGTSIATKTLIWTAGIRSSSICDVIEGNKAKSCRIMVDEYARTQYKNVYAVGDAAAFESSGGMLPALVETALQTGQGAAENILADIRGKEKKKLDPKLHGVMVSIGSYFAVSDIMGRQFPRLISIMLKYLVNIHYLFGIGGFELVIRYIKHEFLHKKQDKTIAEKHISVTTPALWLVPIRIFLGYSWLMEGIKKIQGGWLTKPMFTGLASNAGTGASAASAAADAATGATAAVNAAGGAAAAADAAASATAAAVDAVSSATAAAADAVASAATAAADAVTSATTAAEAAQGGFSIITQQTPDWYAWIAENIIIPNALFFQIMIVLVEIGVAVALITGTFTFIAALASIGLNINFLLSTGMYPHDWWYIPAALCLLGGAGRAFGGDYYLMPYLMRQWRYFVRNKRIKLFLFR